MAWRTFELFLRRVEVDTNSDKQRQFLVAVVVVVVVCLFFCCFFSALAKRVWQHLSWRYILQRVSRIENLIIKLFPRWHTDSSHQRFGNRHVSAEVTPFFSQSGKTKVTLSAKSSGCPRTNLQDPNMNYS